MALLLAACKAPQQQSPYMRVTVLKDGRLYYADARMSIFSDAGGFLSFRDLITGESVRLANGSFEAIPVPYDEVERRRNEYMYNPSKPLYAEKLPEPD